MARTTALVRLGRSLLVTGVLGALRVEPAVVRTLDFGPFEDALAAVDDGRRRQLDDLLPGRTVAELNGLMASGRLTAVELALHHLQRIRDVDDTLRSLLELNPHALDEAAQADRRRAEGTVLGPLDGIPITIKDNIETAGPLHTTAGAAVLAGHLAGRDADVVTAVRDAGAVVLGKANLSELAGAMCSTAGFSALGGQTLNPFGAAFSPAGSSSGSAVSVAAGLCVLSIGTETSGSLIAPAAVNGVVGLKPSRGVVSGRGVIPLVHFQDSAGPIARTVADAALLLHVLGGPPVDLEGDGLAGVRVGVLGSDVLTTPLERESVADNPQVLELLRAGLAAAGAEVVDATTDATAVAGYRGSFVQVVLGGLAHDTMSYLEQAGAPATTLAGLVDYNLAKPRERMPKGQALLGLGLLWETSRASWEQAAVQHRTTATALLEQAFDRAGCAVLASLSAVHATLYATANFPAVTVPLGLRANGVPTGATLIGRPGEDAALLRSAAAFERATALRVAPRWSGRLAVEPQP